METYHLPHPTAHNRKTFDQPGDDNNPLMESIAT